MPVFNEAATLRTIVKRVLDAPLNIDVELICVDDGSDDKSLAILEELAGTDSRIKVVSQSENLGKGKAIRTAIEHMTGDIAIIQDADLEYDPADYPRVIAPILNGSADAVYGSRFASSEVRRVLFFWHSLGNRLLTTLSNMANDINLTDMETCYKAVRSDVLKRLRLTSDRFGLEPEITARLARSGARIYEVPISYHGRTYAEGKSVGWRDGVEALWLIAKFRFIDTRHTNDSGHVTLESLASSPSIAMWMLEQFDDHISGRVLEAGCGSGNLTQHLIGRGDLEVVDNDPLHIATVEKRFGHFEGFAAAEEDLQDESFYTSRSNKFDTVLCVNVLEHLDYPERVLAGFSEALRPGGTALILVPAHQGLYSAADLALEHRKRYSKGDLRQLAQKAGLEVVDLREFNRLGVVGWLFNKWVGRTSIGRLQSRLFGLLLPAARLLERMSFLPGLSLVMVARAR